MRWWSDTARRGPTSRWWSSPTLHTTCFRPDRLFYPRAVADFITRRSVL